MPGVEITICDLKKVVLPEDESATGSTFKVAICDLKRLER